MPPPRRKTVRFSFRLPVVASLFILVSYICSVLPFVSLFSGCYCLLLFACFAFVKKKINRPRSPPKRRVVLKVLILMPQQEVTRPRSSQMPPETRVRKRKHQETRLRPRRTATRRFSTREICSRLQLLPWPRPPLRRNIWPPLRSVKSRVWSRCWSRPR